MRLSGNRWIVEEASSLAGYLVEWSQPGMMLLSRRGVLYRTSSPCQSPEKVARFPTSLWKFVLARSWLGSRLLRFFYFNVLPRVDGTFFVSFAKTAGIICGDEFIPVEGLAGPCRILRSGCALAGDGAVFFGEYIPNKERKEVYIYRLSPGDRRVDIAYTFPAGSIRHVHGIYADRYSGALWCTTGDLPEECGIYKTDDQFRTLEPVLIGDESCRCVSLQFGKRDIFYGSDAEFEQNYLYRIDRRRFKRESILKIDGPVYYSYSFGENVFFGVTAEKCPSNYSKMASIWHIDINSLEASCVFRSHKDIYSVKYFMPGIICFQGGPGYGGEVYFYTVGIENFDGNIYRIKKSSERGEATIL